MEPFFRVLCTSCGLLVEPDRSHPDPVAYNATFVLYTRTGINYLLGELVPFWDWNYEG